MHKLICSLLAGLWLVSAGQVHAEEVSLKLPNGLTAFGSLDLADGKSLKEDGVVLFVHGTLAHKDMALVAAQRSLLNEREINVLAINLSLGLDKRTGMYDCAVPHTHKHSDAMDEIAGWIDWLKEQGSSTIILTGHSRGANQVAWFAAERDVSAVEKIVLIAPQTWEEGKEKASYKKRYNKDLTPILKEMTEAKSDEMKSGVDFIYCADTTVKADSFVNYYTPDQRFNTPDLLAKINKPVLVIAGSADQVVSDLPEKMAKVKQDHVHFQTIEDAGHMFIDFAGEDLADAIAEFLHGT
ncbi:MAG: alpha/beta hydrolase [Methylocystaceae bacterium]|nr:alpha/beta hydrolase [Methylocystaceae bacterium]